MTVVDWVLGALFRPAATYEHARNHLRFGYWWILLSVFTLETVAAVYYPSSQEADTGSVVIVQITILMVLYDLYGAFLWGAARAFQWQLPWVEALKLTALSWSVRLLEDVATFYPLLRQSHTLVIGLSAVFTVWTLISLTIGLRQAYKLPTGRALAIAAMGSLPLRLGELWLYWYFT